MIVGPDQAKFTVHKTLICSRAPFFARATSGEWRSAQTQTVTLSDTKKDVFEAYLHWIYSSTVEMRFIQEPPDYQNAPSYWTLAELWIFADMMLDRDLCNKVIDMTYAKAIMSQTSAVDSTLTLIWENTAADSPLRTLHVDVTTSNRRSLANCEETIALLPQDFILELATRHMKGLDRSVLVGLTERSICARYHTHEDGRSCA